MTLQQAKKMVPLHQKYGLTFEESAAYFGIGETALRRYIREHPDDECYLMVGNKTLIKRKKFETVLDELSSI